MLEDAGPNKPGQMSYILDGVSFKFMAFIDRLYTYCWCCIEYEQQWTCLDWIFDCSMSICYWAFFCCLKNGIILSIFPILGSSHLLLWWYPVQRQVIRKIINGINSMLSLNPSKHRWVNWWLLFFVWWRRRSIIFFFVGLALFGCCPNCCSGKSLRVKSLSFICLATILWRRWWQSTTTDTSWKREKSTTKCI